MAQPNCLTLITYLAESGYKVSVETSGALDISGIDSRAVVVMDVKAPGSGEQARNRLGNLKLLRAQDQIKFVLSDRIDYEWARSFLHEHALPHRAQVLFSAVAGELAPRQLAEWILEDRLDVRFQIQLHKSLWGDVAGH